MRRLIEEGLPLESINEASHREKTGTPKAHPSRLHIWWARRPLAMSRAIVLGSLVPDPGEKGERRRIFGSIEQASSFRDAGVAARIEPLRDRVRAAFPDAPARVLDCFAGGGAIPLEAIRLGCDVTAIDLNPVAHLIERCVLEYPQRLGNTYEHGRNGLAEDVRHWAGRISERTKARVSPAFPIHEDGTQPVVWFWARTTPCMNPSCGIEIPLVKSWWLARGRRIAWIDPSIRGDRVDLDVRMDRPPADASSDAGTVSASSVTCPACGSTIPATDVRRHGREAGFGLRLLATLAINGRDRLYRSPTSLDEDAAAHAGKLLEDLQELPDGVTAIPDEACDSTQGRTLRYLIFGLTHYRELFTPRQLLVAGTLCEETRRAHASMLDEGMEEDRARAIVTYIGLLIGRIVQYNSSFCSWHLTGEKVRDTFSRQAIPMVWDFTEINPFEDVSGDWQGGVDSATEIIKHCSSASTIPAKVIRGDAQNLASIDDATFDAVVVDPPYYDAVQYADLSDYFFVWLKRSVGPLYPELFSTPLTPKAQEIIENRADKKSDSYISPAEFERRLVRAIAEMRRVVKPDGVVSIVFAHTESDAWERLLRALLQAELVVSTSWPMRSEMGSRSTANISAVLGSSVVLVCRPRVATTTGYYDDVVRELDARIAERLDEFERLGLTGADYLISAIGPAFEVFGRYSAVVRLSGEEVSVGDLLALARRTVARHAMRRLLGSDSLAALDDRSLLYLTWRWAYGAARIPVDEAQKLGKAFHVEVDELDGIDGLVERSRESYALRSPVERKKIRLSASPPLVDVLHLACQLYDAGRRRELNELLGASGFASEPTFWAAARAIAESLSDGERERVMLVNLLGSRDQIVEAAGQVTSSAEALRLFEVAE